VVDVQGIPDGKFRELRATIDPATLEREADHAPLCVSWWAEPDDPEFMFHYSERSGFDCSWYREPNTHVDGNTHYQERNSPDEPYEYEAIFRLMEASTRLLWTVLELLADRLQAETSL